MSPPHKLPAYAVIIRAMGGNGAEDQRAALNELYRRRLWLGSDQAKAAILNAGLEFDARTTDESLRGLGYEPTPVPHDARPRLPVIFRYEPGVRATLRGVREPGNVTAVFPTEPGTKDPTTATCYAHVGQHSGCRRSWYSTTSPAKPEEYADLLAELRGIYERDDDPEAVRLVVAKRWTRHHDAARKAELRRMRA